MEDRLARSRSILAVGALHVDDMATPVSSLVPNASNPVLWSRLVGGVAAKTLLAMKHHRGECSAHLLAAMGDDSLGETLTRTVEARGISLCPVRFEHRPTGRYTVVVDQQGELFVGLSDVTLSECITAVHVLNKMKELQPNVLVLDANLSSNCLDEIAEQVAEQRRDSSEGQSAPLVVALAVSPVKSQRLRNLAPVIDLLFCNRREAAALTERSSDTELQTLGSGLVGMGFNDIVLTDGGDSVWVRSHQHTVLIDVPEQSIKDTVNGAGDALAGATLAQWSAGKRLSDSVRDAGLSAAAAVLEGSEHTYFLD